MKKPLLLFFFIIIISGSLIPQVITLKKPDGGEVWKKGDTKSITWTACGLTNDMKVLLLKDNQIHGVIAPTVTFNPETLDYSISWKVGTHTAGTAQPGDMYKIRIREKQTAIKDTSQSNFSITGPILQQAPEPKMVRIKVTSPAESDKFNVGDTVTIRWETTVKKAFKIALYKYNKQEKLLDIATMLLIPRKNYKGKYSFNWKIPVNIPPIIGERRIRVSTYDGKVRGYSEIFTISIDLGGVQPPL